MQKVDMTANTRTGNISAKKLKKDGKIPAVVYGKETKSMPIEIKIRDIEKTVKTLEEGTLLITLKLADKKEEKMVVIQEVQRDPKTDEILHADFHQISEKDKTHFKVPVFGTGTPEGVKLGGTMEHGVRELDVRCLPKDLPDKFELDISALQMNESFSVEDMQIPDGVEVLTGKDTVLFAVHAPRKEEEPKPEEEAAAAEAGKEPEVITEKKKEEKAEEKK